MVNSNNSRSPILLDTPEGATANVTIEINDIGGNARHLGRRRHHDSMDDIVVADRPKRARVEVPVIDLTSDTEEDTEDDTERLVMSMREQFHNSTRRLAELRARREHVMSLLPDDARRQIRRAISLRNRSSLNHPRHQAADDQRGSNSIGDTRMEFTRNQPPTNLHADVGLPPILVDDDDGHSSLFSSDDDFPRSSCSRANPSRVFMPGGMNSRPTFSTSGRSERTRPLTHNNAHSQDTNESESERPSIIHYLDTLHPPTVRASRSRHHQRRRMQLRDCLAYLSPLSINPSGQPTNSDESLAASIQSAEYQVRSPTIDQTLPNVIPEIDGNRLTRRLYPLDQPLQPYMPDLLLPAVFRSIWGPDSRLRHLGEPEDEREDYEALWNLTERLGTVKPKGLSKSDMEEIPSFRYSAASKGSSNGSCVVCMMDYSNKEKLRRLPCNHDFHAKCIDRWLKNNCSCPVCRKGVISK